MNRPVSTKPGGDLSPPHERRDSPRRKTRFKAVIVFGHDRSTATCMVRDMSETGARLDVGPALDLPSRFHLIWTADRAVLEVEAVWRSPGEVGVAFRSRRATDGVVSAELAAVLRAWEQRLRTDAQALREPPRKPT